MQISQAAKHAIDFARREARKLWRSRARGKNRIQGINIKTEVSWRISSDAACFADHGIYAHFFKLFDRNHADALLQRPIAFVRGVGRAADSDLHDSFGIEESFL